MLLDWLLLSKITGCSVSSVRCLVGYVMDKKIAKYALNTQFICCLLITDMCIKN